MPAFQPLASASSSTSPRVSNTPQTPQTAQDDKTEKTTENTQDDDKVQSTAQAMRTDSQTNGASAKKDVAGEENSKPAATTAAASTPAYPTGASGSPTLPELNISGQDELANLRSSICVTGKDSPQKGLAKEAKGKDETAESGPGATPGADGEPQVGQDKSDGKVSRLIGRSPQCPADCQTATVTHEDTKPAINDTTKDTTAASPPVTTRDNLKDPNGITDLPANSSTSVKVIDTAEPTAAATPRYVIDLMDTSSDEEDPDGGAGGFVSSKDSAVRGCAGDMIFKSDPTNVAIGALQLEGVTEPNGKIKVEKESEAEGKA